MNSFPLSIVMVCDSFYPAYSGAGRQALELSKALVARGHNVIILARHILYAPFDEIIEGLRIHRIPVRNRNSKLGYFVSQIVFAFNCWIWIRGQFPTSIVHIHGVALWSMILTILLGKRQKTLIKMTLKGVDDAQTLSKSAFALLFKWAVASASKIISISKALSESYRYAGFPSDKLVEIPNGVDTKRFCPVCSLKEKKQLRQSLGLPIDGRFIIFVGSISERKGVRYLFDAWILLASNYKNIYLIFVGPWNKRQSDILLYRRLKIIANEKKVAERVYFVGQVDDVNAYLKASDLFVLPSCSEGMPNSLLEAMACGLTCCVSYIPGITDSLIIDGKTGFLIRPNVIRCPYSFKKILENALMMSQCNEIGQLARMQIMDHYAIDAVASQYEQYYYLLAGRKKLT